MASDNGIAVCCRVRPINKVEASEGSKNVLNFTSDKSLRLEASIGSHDFAFDRVFPPESTQEEVYRATAMPLVDEIMRGYNCTVFVCAWTLASSPVVAALSDSSDSQTDKRARARVTQ